MWKPQDCHVMCSQVSVSYIKYMCPQYCTAKCSDACIGHALGMCTKYMCPQYCAAMHSDTCVEHVLGMCITCVPEPYNIIHSTKHQNNPR